jgi:4-amino-4-deoxy-L-arabinose transferase-like glycosyltransferase
MINMQPLGFYIGAFFLRIFGSSFTTGVAVTTLFALGCVSLTYKIGETLYGNRTGLFAAALFALTPWQLIMSRVFLVDVPCLFFSLLYLLIGIWAIKKDSLRLFLLAGTVFGLALLTKLFAVFMLIPLALIFVYQRPNLKRVPFGMILFFLPASILQYAWYGIISGRGFLSMFGHDDFGTFLPAGFKASPFYSLSFLGESLGVFFVMGYFFSLLVSFLRRKQFSKLFFFDLTCFATVTGVMGFNMCLVFYGNLLVPYVNSIKYNFLTLPLLCLLAASAAKKCVMISREKTGSPRRRELTAYLASIGPYLLLVSMIFNFMALTTLVKYDWLAFYVPGGLSYSFDRLSPILDSGRAWRAQVLGFMLIQLSLLWANRGRLQLLFASL